MFQKDADQADVKAVVGREMGHYVRKHVLVGALASGLMARSRSSWSTVLFPMAVRG